MIALGRDGFIAKAPLFAGEILWEHLEILQKGKQTNLYFLLFRIKFIYTCEKWQKSMKKGENMKWLIWNTCNRHSGQNQFDVNL